MTPSQHALLLPLLLFTIHLIFLWPLYTSPLPAEAVFHFGYAVAFGIAGFLSIEITKAAAARFPLPQRSWASNLEWTLLFLVGAMEEVWRFGIVRVFVWVEGGGTGFAGGKSSAELEGFGKGGHHKVAVPGLWQNVYLMGWVWVGLECIAAWRTFRPNQREEKISRSQAARAERAHRRGQEGSRSYSGGSYTYRNITPRPDLPRAPATIDGPTLRNFSGAGNGKGSKTSLLIDPRDTSLDIRPPTFSQFTFGASNAFPRPSDSPRSPTTVAPLDVERGDLLDIPGDNNDDDSSGSDTSSIRSSGLTTRALTPLLSSSLPYDPATEAVAPHPHYEQQSLLQAQWRRMSYNTLADTLVTTASPRLPDLPSPVTSDDESDDDAISPTSTRPHNTNDVRIVVQDHDAGSNPSSSQRSRPSVVRPRAYPVYPSYSASYNHSYFAPNPGSAAARSAAEHPFPPSNNSSTTTSPTTSPTTPTFPPQHRLSYPPPRPPPTPPTTSTKLTQILGTDPSALPIYLPLIWRLAAIMRLLGHVLIFAWLPSLIHNGRWQLWTALMLAFVCGRRGWYVVEFASGAVARNGAGKISMFILGLGMLSFVVGLGVWGVIG